MTRRKKWIILLSVAVLSILLALLFPSNVGKDRTISSISFNEENSIISQRVTSILLEPRKVTKYYLNGDLLGVVEDNNLIKQQIEKENAKLVGTVFDGYSVNLSDELYTVEERSFWKYENKDQEVLDYLTENQMFVVRATEISIYDKEELVDVVYVKSQYDFQKALKRFVLNFIDNETFVKLDNNETILSLTAYGQQDVKAYVEETIKATQKGASTEEILTNEDMIFDYLCYGKDTELKYYTVVEFDTVDGVGSKNGLSGEQIVAINPNIISREQSLAVGQQVNITYFNSPLTVVVETERLVKETTYPESAEYVVDEKLEAGKVEVDIKEQNGYNDVLYTDVYVNGILSGYRVDKITVVVEPTRARYRVGAGAGYYDTGDLSFRLPCDHPVLTCDMACYANHHGVDFQDRYDLYGYVYACERGVITENGYNSSMGNYYYINHGYGYELAYYHMSAKFIEGVGIEVVKGQALGRIGNTGWSTAPHIHIGVFLNGEMLNPCSPGLLPCDEAAWLRR